MSNCYECDICLGVNHVARLHCQYCATIPAKYSMLGATTRERLDSDTRVFIRVLVAFGVMRQTSHRTIKRVLRTVPADYYATE